MRVKHGKTSEGFLERGEAGQYYGNSAQGRTGPKGRRGSQIHMNGVSTWEDERGDILEMARNQVKMIKN